MAGTTRVPVPILEFNNYIRTTDDYQQATLPPRLAPNWQVLGWALNDSNEWTARRLAWEPLYTQYSDPAQRTPVVIANVNTFMKSFRTFAQPLLDLVAASPKSIDRDAMEFNLVLLVNRKDPTHHTTPISDDIFPMRTSRKGGEVTMVFRTLVDGSRASLPKAADSVRIATRVGGPPASPDDGCTYTIFTKARGIVNFGVAYKGKAVSGWAQWYNTRHPELAGNWVPLEEVIVN